MTKSAVLLVFLSCIPHYCLAFDWGDFHIFAVIFFSFLGGFLGLGAIFGAMYFACGRPFLARFKNEVAQSHRERHPWPPGSVRWRLQQLTKSGEQFGETRFPVQKTPIPHSYAQRPDYVHGMGNYPGSFYQRALDYCGSNVGADREPIIASRLVGDYYPNTQPSFHNSILHSSYGIEHPIHLIPSVEKNLPPVKEEIEEYRMVREESFVSSTGKGSAQPITTAATTTSTTDPVITTIVSTTTPAPVLMPETVHVIRTTQTTHTRRKSPARLPNTYI